MTPSEQPFVVRFDRADGMGVARFANVGHINEPIRERNWPPLGSLHRLITAGTYHHWNLCFVRSEHGPVPHQRIPMAKYVCSVAAAAYQQAPPWVRFQGSCNLSLNHWLPSWVRGTRTSDHGVDGLPTAHHAVGAFSRYRAGPHLGGSNENAFEAPS